MSKCILDIIKYESTKSTSGKFLANGKSTNFNGRITPSTFRIGNIAIKFIPYSLFIWIECNFICKQTKIRRSLILLHIFEQISYSHKFFLKILCILKKEFIQIVVGTFEWFNISV